MTSSVTDGRIVLGHDTRPWEVAAWDKTLSALRKKGILPVTVEDLMALRGVALLPNHLYYGTRAVDLAKADKVMALEDRHKKSP